MTSSIKWIVYCIVFAAVSIFLYTTIDSNWSQKNNASIWLTICFFLSAVATILCGFNAIDKEDSVARM
jgi:amino acid transporter